MNVRAEYGKVNTGTTADDSNKLVLRYINEENGTYVIDGVGGSSAYSVFYNASGEPSPT
jgi:flagellin